MTRFAFAAHAAAVAGFVALLPVPAAAQEAGGEKVNQLIVYGDDPCPASSDGTITVCARKEESERYRIPTPLRGIDPNTVSQQAWTEKVKAYETVGAFGINSCSPVGSGGASGCVTRLIDRAYAEKRNATDVQFGRLIEEERARRLQNLDENAAAEQARVEQIEKAYEEKLKRERQAAGETPPASTPADPASAPLATPPQP